MYHGRPRKGNHMAEEITKTALSVEQDITKALYLTDLISAAEDASIDSIRRAAADALQNIGAVAEAWEKILKLSRQIQA